MLSVIDFSLSGRQKVFDVKANKLRDFPESLNFLNAITGQMRSKTFCSVSSAFSLSKTDASLVFLFNNFKQNIEIVNHDCIDFVFYHDCHTSEIKVLSFLE
jgi:hypothetical protein